jgi:hypothetical protein
VADFESLASQALAQRFGDGDVVFDHQQVHPGSLADPGVVEEGTA